MAEQEYVVNSSFLLKRGFAKDWEKLNPLLKQGEIGFILDQNAIKIGDGVTLWNALPIVGDDEFGKFESKIREELEKGWKKPVRFTKSVAIGSAEASGAGSFAMGRYKPFSVKNGWDYNRIEKSDIRRLTKEETERLYEYTGVYYEYVSLDDYIDDEYLQQAIYFVDTEHLVHITESVYIDWHLDDDEEGDSGSHDFFNIREGEVIDTDYTGPIVYLYASTDYCESDIRSLTEDEQNAIFEKTGTIYQYIDQSGSMPEDQYITISRPIGKTIHVTESEYVEIEDELNESDLVEGDVFNIAEGENIETPCQAYGYEYIKDDYDHHRYYRFYRLTSTARELVYNKTGKYYEYIDRKDSIENGKAPTIELYDIERYGHVVTQSEYIQTSDGFPVTGLAFNIKDNIGFKAPYKGIMLYNYCPVEMGIDLENYKPTAVASGELAFAQGDHVIASGNYSHAEGNYTTASEYASHAEGSQTEATGSKSHAEGYGTIASGSNSHAEGSYTTASGNCSHAEGYNTKATKTYAHAEGSSTTASGQYAHAEGQNTTASGGTSHAEGGSTIASSNFSHAEGFSTKASGARSHAEGAGTIAAGEAQHAQGRYNIEDTANQHAFIIGNGEDANNRSNAFTVDWNGDTKMAGWLDTQGLYGNTLTRNLYVGGAKNIDGNWQPKNPFIVDYAEKYSVKNQAYVSTMKVPKEGTYWLTAPKGSNYIYKIQIQYANGSTNTFDINSLPTSTAGQYGSYYEYNYNSFTAIFGDKTRVDSSSKSFPDGSTCYKRFNMQNGLKHYDNNLEQPYPAIKFYVDRAAAVKVWWVAGDANRPLTIQTEQNGGGASIDVSSEIRVHGTGHFYESLNVEGHVSVGEEVRTGGPVYVGGDLEVDETARINNDLHVGGYISCGESLDMNGNDIKNVQSLRMTGTLEVENDSNLRSIKPLETGIYRIGTDEKYYDKVHAQRHFIQDKTTGRTELVDYSRAKALNYHLKDDKTMVLNSSTEGSKKVFKITVDDDGALKAVEWMPSFFTKNSPWYKGSIPAADITKIIFKNSYKENKIADEEWDVSLNSDGSVICYRYGTELIVIHNDSPRVLLSDNNKYAIFPSVTNLELDTVDTSNITTMHSMFSECNSLTKLDLSNFDTSKVTNMHEMFRWCNSLTELNLSSFNTSKVTDMWGMFVGCKALTNLDISNFNTSKVTEMYGMFNGCSSLTNLDLRNFDISSTTELFNIFGGCSSLTNLDLSHWNTGHIINMSNLFGSCSSLTSLDLGNFDTSNVTNMSFMFGGCTSLINLDLSNFDTSNATNMKKMFSNCNMLTNLSIGGPIKYSGFELKDCVNLTHDSLVNVINALYDGRLDGVNRTISLGSTNLAKLTAQEKLIMTNKKWTYS